jgi:enoyl-CoA hydratase
MEIALLCRTIDAQRAERIGLVNEVVAEGEALATAKQWATDMCGMAPMVLWEIKRMVTEEIIPRGPSEQMAIHGQRMAAIRNSADFEEGKAAFRDKRAPNFEGR